MLRIIFSTLFLVFGYPDEPMYPVFDISLHSKCVPKKMLKAVSGVFNAYTAHTAAI